MPDDKPKPSPKLLNARARGLALIDLSKKHPEEFRRYYYLRKRELFIAAGVPISRRHVKHKDDGQGLCDACGNIFPCGPARRRAGQ